MKKLLISIAAIALFSCEEQRKIEGYIVAKEYTPEHMSNETPRVVSYAMFIPVHTPTQHPAPHKVNASWVLYIANKREVRDISVSEKVFNYSFCGEKVIIRLK